MISGDGLNWADSTGGRVLCTFADEHFFTLSEFDERVEDDSKTRGLCNTWSRNYQRVRPNEPKTQVGCGDFTIYKGSCLCFAYP